MNNADIFKYPGDIAGTFILSLFDVRPQQVDDVLFNLLVILLALFFWVQVIGIVMALLRRLTGFERRR